MVTRTVHPGGSCRALSGPPCRRFTRLLLSAEAPTPEGGGLPAPGPEDQAEPNVKVRKWILVAEDDRNIRSLLSRVLTEAGYAVVTARDGIEALELMREIRPHLILLDLRMPRLSGVQFLAHSRRIPTVVLSGFLGDLPDDAGMQANIVARLEKPVSLDVLRSTVHRLLVE